MLDIRIRLNPENEKEKLIIDMLEQHISSSSIIVKDLLYGIAINRQQQFYSYGQIPYAPPQNFQPPQYEDVGYYNGNNEGNNENDEDNSDLEAMVDDLDLGI